MSHGQPPPQPKLGIAGPSCLHDFRPCDIEAFVDDDDPDEIPCAVTLAAQGRMWLERIPGPLDEPGNDNGAELARRAG